MSNARTATRAALGARAHSGWAILVAVAGSARFIRVLDRRRISLADPAVPGFPQPYHAAEPLPLQQAEQLVRRCVEASGRLAEQAFRAAIIDLRTKGYEVTACGILVRLGRPLPPFAKIIASHALIHTAEGVMFRDVLRHGAERCGLTVSTTRERDARDHAAEVLGIPASDIQDRIQQLGRELGPPWREDQKLATLAAWVALQTRRGLP